MAAVEDIRDLPAPDGVDLKIGDLSAITADDVDDVAERWPYRQGRDLMPESFAVRTP